MNDFSEIEDKLRKLRPVQPSADLMARIERSLAEQTSTSTAGALPREHRFHFSWVSLGLGLAAAAALVLFARFQLERPVKKTPTLAAITPAPAFSSPSSTAQFAKITEAIDKLDRHQAERHAAAQSAPPLPAAAPASLAAPDVTGREGRVERGLPHDEVLELLRARGAL